MEPIKFFGSQIGGQDVTSHSYTGNPLTLMRDDIKLIARLTPYIPYILWPLKSTSSLCELAPTLLNAWSVFLHIILFCMQASFMLSVPLWMLVPVWLVALGAAIFTVANSAVCYMLNGPRSKFYSDPKYAIATDETRTEQWVFVNGITIGKHWLQSNIDRLALTFGRPVMGVHNRTSGFLFDLIECLIQRNFDFAGGNVRTVYAAIKELLYDQSLDKVVMILHSQGAIEGGMVLDWLLEEVPSDLLSKLEIYSFGNAARHFNNPHRSYKGEERAFAASQKRRSWTILPTTQTNGSNGRGNQAVENNDIDNERVIHHIEHYSHTEDFVARFGILNFISPLSTTAKSSPSCPRFMGRAFERVGSGHLLNMHYLDAMFPLRPARSGNGGIGGSGFTGAKEENEFMEQKVEWAATPSAFPGPNCREGLEESAWALGATINGVKNLDDDRDDASVSPRNNGHGKKGGLANGDGAYLKKMQGKKEYRVKDLSRLWQYRNGKKPVPDAVDLKNARMCSIK